MHQKFNHSWNLSEQQAIELQLELSQLVIKKDELAKVKLVAGIDVAYDKDQSTLKAGVVVLEAGSLQEVERVVIEDVSNFPYIPGLFSFRELPPICKALAKLKNTPDLIVCDGQGMAHPRRFGLASHLGVLYDIPVIGCGKTKLLGDGNEPGEDRGEYSYLTDRGEIIRASLRTQSKVRPVYVSIGHRISLETSLNWVFRLCPRYRLPETTRKADQLVRKVLWT
jgi:deoxyribonuclease V